MEIVAHGLWASAVAILANRSSKRRISVGWAVWWAAFPDVLAFGPSVVAGVWLRFAGAANPGSAEGHVLPHVHIGLPLYQAGHSLIVFLVAFAIVTLLAHRVVFEMLGWLMHIVIDIPTHSLSYYATRFLWPVSDYRVDGVAWWTPWLWVTTYAALGAVFLLLWKTRSTGKPSKLATAIDTERA